MYSLTYTLLFIQSSDVLYIVSIITKIGLFDFQLVIFNTSFLRELAVARIVTFIWQNEHIRIQVLNLALALAFS